MTPPPSSRTADVVRRVGIASWSILGVIVLLGVVVWLLSQIGILLPPVVLALAVVYILNPVVTRLQRFGIHRILGSCLSYIVLIGVLIAVGFLIVPSISGQATEFVDSFPEIFDEAVADLEDLGDRFGITAELPSYEDVQDFLSSEDTQDQFLSAFWERLGDLTLGLLEVLLVFVLAPVIALYVLMDLPKLRQQAIGLVPETSRAEVLHVTRQLGRAVGGFLRGQVLVASIVGVMSAVGFLAIGLPFWLIIGIIAGLLNIVPFVGPWVGGALGVTVALFTGDLTTAFWAIVVAVSVQQIDNHFISPLVLRATVRLHPAAIILALIAAGSIAGVWGVLLAVPFVASVKIVAGHLWRTRILGQTWEEATEALIEERVEDPELLVGRLRRQKYPEADVPHDIEFEPDPDDVGPQPSPGAVTDPEDPERGGQA